VDNIRTASDILWNGPDRIKTLITDPAAKLRDNVTSFFKNQTLSTKDQETQALGAYYVSYKACEPENRRFREASEKANQEANEDFVPDPTVDEVFTVSSPTEFAHEVSYLFAEKIVSHLRETRPIPAGIAYAMSLAGQAHVGGAAVIGMHAAFGKGMAASTLEWKGLTSIMALGMRAFDRKSTLIHQLALEPEKTLAGLVAFVGLGYGVSHFVPIAPSELLGPQAQLFGFNVHADLYAQVYNQLITEAKASAQYNLGAVESSFICVKMVLFVHGLVENGNLPEEKKKTFLNLCSDGKKDGVFRIKDPTARAAKVDRILDKMGITEKEERSKYHLAVEGACEKALVEDNEKRLLMICQDLENTIEMTDDQKQMFETNLGNNSSFLQSVNKEEYVVAALKDAGLDPTEEQISQIKTAITTDEKRQSPPPITAEDQKLLDDGVLLERQHQKQELDDMSLVDLLKMVGNPDGEKYESKAQAVHMYNYLSRRLEKHNNSLDEKCRIPPGDVLHAFRKKHCDPIDRPFNRMLSFFPGLPIRILRRSAQLGDKGALGFIARNLGFPLKTTPYLHDTAKARQTKDASLRIKWPGGFKLLFRGLALLNELIVRPTVGATGWLYDIAAGVTFKVWNSLDKPFDLETSRENLIKADISVRMEKRGESLKKYINLADPSVTVKFSRINRFAGVVTRGWNSLKELAGVAVTEEEKSNASNYKLLSPITIDLQTKGLQTRASAYAHDASNYNDVEGAVKRYLEHLEWSERETAGMFLASCSEYLESEDTNRLQLMVEGLQYQQEQIEQLREELETARDSNPVDEEDIKEKEEKEEKLESLSINNVLETKKFVDMISAHISSDHSEKAQSIINKIITLREGNNQYFMPESTSKASDNKDASIPPVSNQSNWSFITKAMAAIPAISAIPAMIYSSFLSLNATEESNITLSDNPNEDNEDESEESIDPAYIGDIKQLGINRLVVESFLGNQLDATAPAIDIDTLKNLLLEYDVQNKLVVVGKDNDEFQKLVTLSNQMVAEVMSLREKNRLPVPIDSMRLIPVNPPIADQLVTNERGVNAFLNVSSSTSNMLADESVADLRALMNQYKALVDVSGYDINAAVELSNKMVEKVEFIYTNCGVYRVSTAVMAPIVPKVPVLASAPVPVSVSVPVSANQSTPTPSGVTGAPVLAAMPVVPVPVPVPGPSDLVVNKSSTIDKDSEVVAQLARNQSGVKDFLSSPTAKSIHVGEEIRDLNELMGAYNALVKVDNNNINEAVRLSNEMVAIVQVINKTLKLSQVSTTVMAPIVLKDPVLASVPVASTTATVQIPDSDYYTQSDSGPSESLTPSVSAPSVVTTSTTAPVPPLPAAPAPLTPPLVATPPQSNAVVPASLGLGLIINQIKQDIVNTFNEKSSMCNYSSKAPMISNQKKALESSWENYQKAQPNVPGESSSKEDVQCYIDKANSFQTYLNRVVTGYESNVTNPSAWVATDVQKTYDSITMDHRINALLATSRSILKSTSLGASGVDSIPNKPSSLQTAIDLVTSKLSKSGDNRPLYKPLSDAFTSFCLADDLKYFTGEIPPLPGDNEGPENDSVSTGNYDVLIDKARSILSAGYIQKSVNTSFVCN